MGRRLQFPEVVHIALRPDTVLWSTKDRKIILVELTKLSDNIGWMQFDDDLDSILEAALAGPVHKKVDSLTTIAYNFA